MLQQPFIQRAFLVGLIIAVLSSILSVFIVLKRVSLIGDGLGHTAFGGLALGYYLGFEPLWVASIIVVLGSMGITKAIRSTKIAGDAAVALFLELGLAVGGLLVALGIGVNLESLLFGSIILVNIEQILIAGTILIATMIVVLVFYKELVLVAFDETQAKAAGLPTWFFDYLLSALAGVAVMAAIPIVGVLLISALLVLPALTSLQVSRSFRQTLYFSQLFGLLTVALGLLLCIIFNTAPGATIVLVGIGIFLLTLIGKRTAQWLVD